MPRQQRVSRGFEKSHLPRSLLPRSSVSRSLLPGKGRGLFLASGTRLCAPRQPVPVPSLPRCVRGCWRGLRFCCSEVLLGPRQNISWAGLSLVEEVARPPEDVVSRVGTKLSVIKLRLLPWLGTNLLLASLQGLSSVHQAGAGGNWVLSRCFWLRGQAAGEPGGRGARRARSCAARLDPGWPTPGWALAVP